MHSWFLIGNALTCTTCGDDGVCKDGAEVKPQICEAGIKNCFISLGSDGNGNFVDVKGCAKNTGNDFAMRGCVHITENVGIKHEINEEVCFCDTDECNSHRCGSEFCSCPFSDPYNCRNITERKYPSLCKSRFSVDGALSDNPLAQNIVGTKSPPHNPLAQKSPWLKIPAHKIPKFSKYSRSESPAGAKSLSSQNPCGNFERGDFAPAGILSEGILRLRGF